MCAGNVETLLNDVILKLETAMASSSGDTDVTEAVSSVQSCLTGHAGMHHQYGELMALHGSVAKLGKVVDKHFTLDISKAVVAECELNPRLVDKIIVEHLFHDGLFDVGETYAAEANIKKQNLAPLLQWVVDHEDELQGPNKEPSKFEFQIRQLEYLQLLEKQGMCLLGCIEASTAAFDGGFDAQDSPLLVTVAAGATALPTLLKLAAVVPIPNPPPGEITPETYQLQVEIPLGSEFVFNSIFACPVSKDQSIMKIAKTMNRSFKCPYCPAETTAAMCTEIIFPDVE
ncbi:hypothetical protein H632_c303p2 [Helicosporidium sp. ATCC 50920]|nr:hypothetical protein H632_c303p2 [Helicosporidium sp. ATCC 50920]|eukprot:KDD76241.1 hypothetical protein H632_c303p2 [Helicosporidium sp. ATCC 50920]